MTRRLFTLASVLSLLAFLGGCNVAAQYEDQDLRWMKSGGFVAVPSESFTQVRVGMTRPQVERLFGSSGRHQFTLAHQQDQFRCVAYWRPHMAGEFYYVLYRNGGLWKVLGDSAGFPDNLRSANAKTQTIFGLDRATQLIDRGVGLATEELDKRVRRYEQRLREPNTNDANIPTWLAESMFVAGSPAMEAKIERNAALERRQDGSRVALGMTPEQVRPLLGPPVEARVARGNLVAVTYGHSIDLDVAGADAVEAKPVIVVYEQQRAVAVLSHDFASDEAPASSGRTGE